VVHNLFLVEFEHTLCTHLLCLKSITRPVTVCWRCHIQIANMIGVYRLENKYFTNITTNNLLLLLLLQIQTAASCCKHMMTIMMIKMMMMRL